MRVERGLRRARRARHDRPVDQREERELVARRIEPDRLAGFERGALREEQREALQARLADVVDLGIAGDDVGEARVGRDLLGEVVGRRIGLAAGAGGVPCAKACDGEQRCASAARAAARRPPRAGAAAARCRPPASQNTTSASITSSASAAEEQRAAQILRLAEAIGLDAARRAARSRAGSGGRRRAACSRRAAPPAGHRSRADDPRWRGR